MICGSSGACDPHLENFSVVGSSSGSGSTNTFLTVPSKFGVASLPDVTASVHFASKIILICLLSGFLVNTSLKVVVTVPFSMSVCAWPTTWLSWFITSKSKLVRKDTSSGIWKTTLSPGLIAIESGNLMSLYSTLKFTYFPVPFPSAPFVKCISTSGFFTVIVSPSFVISVAPVLMVGVSFEPCSVAAGVSVVVASDGFSVVVASVVAGVASVVAGVSVVATVSVAGVAVVTSSA